MIEVLWRNFSQLNWDKVSEGSTRIFPYFNFFSIQYRIGLWKPLCQNHRLAADVKFRICIHIHIHNFNMDILVSMDIGLSISIDASISKVQLNIFSLVSSFCKIVITKSLTKIFNENLIYFN